MSKKKQDLSDWGDESREERLRRAIDSWIGTLIQVVGFLLLVYALTIDKLHNPALLPAAMGLFFLKNVAGRKE